MERIDGLIRRRAGRPRKTVGEERIETVVIGGGQAGLVTGFNLKRLNLPFVILDDRARTGDSWRDRWDSLRLFSPGKFSSLLGMEPPWPATHFPTKDEVADYLEAYARRHELTVRHGVRVERLARRSDGRFSIRTSAGDLAATNVVVAMANFQVPQPPPFAGELDPSIRQMHAADYRNPSELRRGPVLVVGAGDSGCEVAMDNARFRKVWLAGRHPGHVPIRIDTRFGRSVGVNLVITFLFHRVLCAANPFGRFMRRKMLGSGGPTVRIRPSDLTRAGVLQVPRVARVERGLPVLEDGRVLNPASVVWCTGFRPGFSWVDIPIFHHPRLREEPDHVRGVVRDIPGLYFVGLFFQYALSSSVLRGVSRDAEHVACRLKARMADLDGAGIGR